MVAYFATTHIIFQLPFLTCQCILGIFNPSLQKFNFYTASFSARYLALTILFFFRFYLTTLACVVLMNFRKIVYNFKLPSPMPFPSFEYREKTFAFLVV